MSEQKIEKISATYKPVDGNQDMYGLIITTLLSWKH